MVKTEVGSTNCQELLAEVKHMVLDALTGLFVCVEVRKSLLKRKQAAILLRVSTHAAGHYRMKINQSSNIIDGFIRYTPLML